MAARAGARQPVGNLDRHVRGLARDFPDLDAIEQDAPLPARERVLHQVADRAARRERVRLVQQAIETGAEVGPHQLLARPRAEDDADRLAHAGLEAGIAAAGRARRAPAAAASRSTGAARLSHQLSLRFGNGMQILMNSIQRKIRSNSDRKMFRQMNAQIVMIGRLKLQIHPTVNAPPPDALPSSRSFGFPSEQVLQRRRHLEGDVRLERPQQVAVGDVGQRDLHRRRAGAFVPRRDHERLAVGAPFGARRAGALRLQPHEGAQLTYRAPGSSKRPGWRFMSAKRLATARDSALRQPRARRRHRAPATTPASRAASPPDRARAARGSRARGSCRRRRCAARSRTAAARAAAGSLRARANTARPSARLAEGVELARELAQEQDEPLHAERAARRLRSVVQWLDRQVDRRVRARHLDRFEPAGCMVSPPSTKVIGWPRSGSTRCSRKAADPGPKPSPSACAGSTGTSAISALDVGTRP